ncbi:MAG: hypothetical protein ABIE84_04040 [bacterium]
MKIKCGLFLLLCLSHATLALSDPATLINKVKNNFQQIKTISADITLDYNLSLLGCGTGTGWPGKLYYKSPDKLKVEFKGRETYFAQGNKIRKIDNKGKRYYVTLINAIDMSVGFHPGLITHNFNLKTLSETETEAIIEGTPKPGILKNAKKLIFYFDKERWLLTKFDVLFPNPNLSGTIEISYAKIKGLWIPTGFHGKSALEVRPGMLVGLGLNFSGKNIQVNSGLPDKVLNPGF